jgi:hypothetical protein
LRATIFQNPEGTLWTHGTFTTGATKPEDVLPYNAFLCVVFIASMRTMTSSPRNGTLTSNFHVVIGAGSRTQEEHPNAQRDKLKASNNKNNHNNTILPCFSKNNVANN